MKARSCGAPPARGRRAPGRRGLCHRCGAVFLAGDTGTQPTLEFLEKTKAPYMTKPVDIPKLLEMVRSISPAK